MIKLSTFLSRLSKIGVSLHCSSNYPWVYIDSINGKNVEEKYGSEHGWVLGFFDKNDDLYNDDLYCEDLKEVFKLIRKYK